MSILGSIDASDKTSSSDLVDVLLHSSSLQHILVVTIFTFIVICKGSKYKLLYDDDDEVSINQSINWFICMAAKSWIESMCCSSLNIRLNSTYRHIKQFSDRRNIICTVSIVCCAREVRSTCAVVSRAEAWPHRGEVSFATTVARNTSWSESDGSPWSRRTRRTQSILHDASRELTWSAAVNFSSSTTPSAVILCSWQMSRQVGESLSDLLHVPRPVNIISLYFEEFNSGCFSMPRSECWQARLHLWVN